MKFVAFLNILLILTLAAITAKDIANGKENHSDTELMGVGVLLVLICITSLITAFSIL